jgi:hypothetical protein
MRLNSSSVAFLTGAVFTHAFALAGAVNAGVADDIASDGSDTASGTKQSPFQNFRLADAGDPVSLRARAHSDFPKTHIFRPMKL